MNSPLLKSILSYIDSYSRNKIVFYKERLLDITPIDVGKLLSQSLFNFKNERQLPMKAYDEINRIFDKAVFDHPNFGKTLAIANLGILFEAELKQNFKTIIDNHSTNNLLLIEWKGEIESGTLHFMSKERGIKININNLSHIAL